MNKIDFANQILHCRFILKCGVCDKCIYCGLSFVINDSSYSVCVMHCEKPKTPVTKLYTFQPVHGQ